MNAVKTVKKSSMLPICFVIWMANVLMLKAAKRTKAKVPPTLFPLFWGGAGMGKTSVIETFHDFVSSRIPNIFAPGIMSVNLSMMDGADFEMPLPNHAAGRIDRAVLFDFAANPQIIFADEVNRYLTYDTINAWCRVFLDRKATRAPAAGSFIVAAANPSSMSGTKEVPQQVSNRACHIYLTEDGSNVENVEYLERVTEGRLPRWMDEVFRLTPIVSQDDHEDYAVVTSRSREYVAWLELAIAESAKYDVTVTEAERFALYAGVVGQNEAAKLMLARKMASLPTLGDVLANPSGVTIPDSKIDHGLRKSHALHLIDSVTSVRDAGLLLTYFLRFDGEFQRYAIEALADKIPAVKERHEYKSWLTR